jgi:hypothetical protein
MPDPATITLVGVGATVLGEGIKFLFGQAGELIKRWRERRDKKAAAAEPAKPIEVRVELPHAIRGESFIAEVDENALGDDVKTLESLYGSLAIYANSVSPIETSDTYLIERADALRGVLEQLYQRPLNFEGEKRDGPSVFGRAKVETLRDGTVAGTLADTISGGHVEGNAQAKEVLGGTLAGVKAGKIG